MIANDHIEKLIMRYLLQEIDADELFELEKWINESPENKSFFFEIKNTSDLSRHSAFSKKEIEESWERMFARMDENTGLNFNDKSPNINFSWIKYAAAILILFVLSWGTIRYMNDNFFAKETSTQVFYNEIIVEKGGRGNTLILSDGTKVILNASTSFKYPTNFSDSIRTVYLNGEAMFEVTKDEQKPFVVRLKKQDITVLGASFNVEAYSDEAYNTITLLSGSVLLKAYKENGQVVSQTELKPNQQAVVNNITGFVSLRDINTSLAEAWTKGEYKFKDETLALISKRLEKYYNVKIHFENEVIQQAKYTGAFALNQNIQEVLQIINYKKQFKIKWVDNNIFIQDIIEF